LPSKSSFYNKGLGLCYFGGFLKKAKRFCGIWLKIIIKKEEIVACAGIEGVEADISAEKLFQSSLSHLISKVTFIGFSSL